MYIIIYTSHTRYAYAHAHAQTDPDDWKVLPSRPLSWYVHKYNIIHIRICRRSCTSYYTRDSTQCVVHLFMTIVFGRRSIQFFLVANF